MSKIQMQDIQDLGTALLIQVPDTKTKKPRSFTVTGNEHLKLYRKYIALRPVNFKESRFFIKYLNGKCHRQVAGIHKLSGTAQEVTGFLNLPNTNLYTGHCLRRTSATLLVNTGANLTTLKRHGGWQSSSVAESYIDESVTNKLEVSRKILDFVPNISKDNANEVINADQTVSFTSGPIENNQYAYPPIQFNNCTNCTINLHVVTNK